MPHSYHAEYALGRTRRVLTPLFVTLPVVVTLACRDISEPARGERSGSVATAAAGGAGAFVLRGTIVTPTEVIKRGFVGIVDGRIVVVSHERPEIENAIELNTAGVILPGFVDVHNHLPWNALPRWIPPHLYSNRLQWRADPVFQQQVAAHFDHLVGDGDRTGVGNICDMNAYSEMRALVGGVTSILATHRVACIHGLVRNLDYNSGFYGTTELNREHVLSAIEIPPAGAPDARQKFVALAQGAITSSFYEALFLHVSEGVDEVSLEEFNFAESQGLLNPKGVVIHGIALGPTQFQSMAAAGTSLVWSPRSNVTLYGQTTDINAALDAGVRIALAPDWAISGSSNMLDELRFADAWNRTHLGGRLSNRQLMDMVTSVPAREAGIDDEVGEIRKGLRADLLVVKGDEDDPFRAVTSAAPEDIQIMFIDGVPLYGDRNLMGRLWPSDALEEIPLREGSKVLASPAAGFVFSDVVARLRLALSAEGTSLAPLTEPRLKP
jgi:5-methylthioadenosine/S-adenosylhomocysteine deaminase